jgi:hypothetical protein
MWTEKLNAWAELIRDGQVIPGFFLQTGPEPKHAEFEDLVSAGDLLAKTYADVQLDQSFGLIDQSPERWNKLREGVSKLQREAKDNEVIKVLFCGTYFSSWRSGFSVALSWFCSKFPITHRT